MKRYEMFSTTNVKPPIIMATGFADDTSVTRFGPSYRNLYIVHYVLSGSGTFNGNKVGAGQGFLIRPNTFEEYYPDASNPWSFIWFVTLDKEIEYFFDAHNADEKTQIFHFHNSQVLFSVAQRLKKATERWQLSSFLSETFLEVFNACIVKKMEQPQNMTKTYFDFAVNYISTNVNLPISVGDLVKLIGVSQPYLHKIFVKETGMTTKQYILKYKFEHAKRLLLSTELNVSQIAESVGFSSVLEFSKFFKKSSGVSPTEFRK